MRLAPGKIDQIGSESHHNDPKTNPVTREQVSRGIFRREFCKRVISLSVMLLVMLPVVAAAAFYRKNNHFQTVIEFSTIVPVILGIAYAMSPIRRSTFRLIPAAAIFEFAVLYLSATSTMAIILSRCVFSS
jgi:hypothetical protein